MTKKELINFINERIYDIYEDSRMYSRIDGFDSPLVKDARIEATQLKILSFDLENYGYNQEAIARVLECATSDAYIKYMRSPNKFSYIKFRNYSNICRKFGCNSFGNLEYREGRWEEII